MEKTTKIKVSDYYGNPSYYSVMPNSVFNALEAAYLKGENAVFVLKTDFESMIEAYKAKMGL